MKVFISSASLRRWRAHSSEKVVLVPTMGALHEGHAALIRRARKRAGCNGNVVVSIFVNPTQFGKGEDFDVYPRPIKKDLALCRSLGVDAVFRPHVDTLYAPDHSVFVEETKVSEGLCGRSRPGHFRGVCTIVAKLFHLVAPQEAIFGAKDFQQVAVLRRMVRDLDFPVRIMEHPTIRTSDGLALSSRNQYLSAEERIDAPLIYAALQTAEKAFREGEHRASALLALVRKKLKQSKCIRIDYIELVHGQTLESVRVASPSCILAVAGFLGKTRLIDHVDLRK